MSKSMKHQCLISLRIISEQSKTICDPCITFLHRLQQNSQKIYSMNNLSSVPTDFISKMDQTNNLKSQTLQDHCHKCKFSKDYNMLFQHKFSCRTLIHWLKVDYKRTRWQPLIIFAFVKFPKAYLITRFLFLVTYLMALLCTTYFIFYLFRFIR